MPLFGGYAGPKEIDYLFVDGGALRGRIQNLSNRFFGGATLHINFNGLVGNYTKVFYYDALPVREDGESEDAYEARVKPQRELFDSAASTARLHVYEGDARRRRKRGLEQKKVDVMLTVDMLTHAFRRNMHRTTLLTGDNDFKPLIDALVQDGMFVTLWYPVDETSRELMQSADVRQPLDMRRISYLLTPESQRIFQIPKVENVNPATPIGPGELSSWEHDGKRCTLRKQYGGFVVTKEHDANNRTHITSDKLELLRYYCYDSLDMKVPEVPSEG